MGLERFWGEGGVKWGWRGKKGLDLEGIVYYFVEILF